MIRMVYILGLIDLCFKVTTSEGYTEDLRRSLRRFSTNNRNVPRLHACLTKLTVRMLSKAKNDHNNIGWGRYPSVVRIGAPNT
jgi:hypothetical protein